jgi:hypothetical protein
MRINEFAEKVDMYFGTEGIWLGFADSSVYRQSYKRGWNFTIR